MIALLKIYKDIDMKKFTILSIVTASLLLSGCGDKTKEATTKAASEVSQAVKEDTQHAVQKAKDVTKEVVAKAKDKATEVVKDVKQKAHEVKEDIKSETKDMVQKAKDKISDIKEEAPKKVEEVKQDVAKKAEAVTASKTAETTVDAKALFGKCVACHGADGKNKALNVSAVIAGQSASDIETKLQEYKAHKRNVTGMGATMSAQAASLSDEDIKALATYISAL